MTNKKAATDMGITMSVACLFSVIGKYFKIEHKGHCDR